MNQLSYLFTNRCLLLFNYLNLSVRFAFWFTAFILVLIYFCYVYQKTPHTFVIINIVFLFNFIPDLIPSYFNILSNSWGKIFSSGFFVFYWTNSTLIQMHRIDESWLPFFFWNLLVSLFHWYYIYNFPNDASISVILAQIM